MRTLVAALLLLLLLALVGCGRSETEQRYYNLGWGYADSIMKSDMPATNRDDLITLCAAYAIERDIVPKSDEANALRDGCWDRWDEE